MVEVFEDCSNGRYVRTVVKTTKSKSEIDLEFKNGSPVIKGIVKENTEGKVVLVNVSFLQKSDLVDSL